MHRRLAAFAAALLLSALPAARADDAQVVNLPAAEVRVANVHRHGPECVEFDNVSCTANDPKPPADPTKPVPSTCRLTHHKRCTTGGMYLAFTVTVSAHPGALRIEAWEVQPGCLVKGGSCSKGSRASFDWTVSPAEVGQPATREVSMEGPLVDDPRSRVELVVGGTARILLPANGADCANVAALLPTAAVVRSRLDQVRGAAPTAAVPYVDALRAYSDARVTEKMADALSAARCASGGAAGPADPYVVPADQVKAWVLAVIDDPASVGRLSAFRSIIDELPADAVRWGWLRAVELRRGWPVGTAPPRR